MSKPNHSGNNTSRRLPYPEINGDECKGCGRCVRACPHQLLKIGDNGNDRGYKFVVYNGGDCTGCALCYYSCPEPHAIRIHRQPRRSSPTTKQKGGVK